MKHHSFIFVVFNILMRRKISVQKSYVAHGNEADKFATLPVEERAWLVKVVAGHVRSYDKNIPQKVREVMKVLNKVRIMLPIELTMTVKWYESCFQK